MPICAVSSLHLLTYPLKQTVLKIIQEDLCARLCAIGLQLECAAISKIKTGYREVADIDMVALSQALDVSLHCPLRKKIFVAPD